MAKLATSYAVFADKILIGYSVYVENGDYLPYDADHVPIKVPNFLDSHFECVEIVVYNFKHINNTFEIRLAPVTGPRLTLAANDK